MLAGLKPSVGTVGDALDNGLAETTIGLYKTECVRDGSRFRSGPLRTLADLEHITSGHDPALHGCPCGRVFDGHLRGGRSQSDRGRGERSTLLRPAWPICLDHQIAAGRTASVHRDLLIGLRK